MKILIGIFVIIVIGIISWRVFVWTPTNTGSCKTDFDCKSDCPCGCIPKNKTCLSNAQCKPTACSGACYCQDGKCKSWGDIAQEAFKTKNIDLCNEIKNLGCKNYCLKISNEAETADWKTYRNGEYGYEIKYPRDWTLDISGYPENISFKEPTQTFTGVGVNMDNHVYNNLEEVEKYWRENTALEIEKAEEIIDNSLKGYKVVGSIPAFGETPNSKIIFITFPLENKGYSIYIMCSSDINLFDTYTKTFSRIINSFIIK